MVVVVVVVAVAVAVAVAVNKHHVQILGYKCVFNAANKDQ